MARRYRVDWGHLAFIMVIAVGVVCYLCDAMSVSMNVNNLLFIGPVGVFALILCCAIVPQCIHIKDSAVRHPQRQNELVEMQVLSVRNRKELVQIVSLTATLGATVFLLDFIGFDIAIWLFATAVMVICGERRPAVLALFPLACAVLIVAGFRAMLPYPMFTAIL